MSCFRSGSRVAVAALRVAAVAAACAAAVVVDARAQMTVQPSGRATTEVVLTPAKPAEGSVPARSVVRIDYGQPHLRGRQLHTGDLVPYGEPWRLGANASTTLMSEVDLVVGGTAIPKGKYVLRALPAKDRWTLLVEKDAGQSPMGTAPTEKPAEVVARIDLKHTTVQVPLESFTMWLIPSTAAGPAHGELRFAWGTDMLSTTWTTK